MSALAPPLRRDVPTTTVSPTSMVKVVSMIALFARGAAGPRVLDRVALRFGQARVQIFDLAIHSAKLHLQFRHFAGRGDANLRFPLRLLDLLFKQRRLVLQIGNLPSRRAQPV